MKRPNHQLIAAPIIALALAAIIGCSSQLPTQPANPLTSGPGTDDGLFNSSASSVELYGRVATIDAGARTMTLVDNPTFINVMEGAEIVFKDGDSETPIDLSNISPGDSAEVRGTIQGDSSLLADRVRIRPDNANGNELEVAGRVEAIDPGARTITLVGNPLLINVATTAEIVQKSSGNEMPIALSDIAVGDSVDIRGNLQTDGSLLADRVRLRLGVGDDFVADINFKGAITAIDYATGSFTVHNRTETILTDSNTFIYVEAGNKTTSGAALGEGEEDDDPDDDLKMSIAFTDLAVGDTVEVHANVIDPSTLYAVAIELEDGDIQAGLEVEFKDFLATVDTNTGTVTFQNETWIGTVVPGAELLGLLDEPLTLADFMAGELVEAKGFKTGDNTFDIVHMHKDNAI